MRRGFSYSTVLKAAMMMRMGIKPAYHVSNELSDEDIARAGRRAWRRVFGDKKADNFERLKEISELGEDWNGYGADSIPYVVVDEVRRIISALNAQPDGIFPTGRKSIQLEYYLLDDSYLELEIFEDKIVVMQVMRQEYNNAQFWDLTHDDIAQIQQIVSNFVNTQETGMTQR